MPENAVRFVPHGVFAFSASRHVAALQKMQGGVADLSVVARHPSPYLMQEPENRVY
jgi:hypothetical protein